MSAETTVENKTARKPRTVKVPESPTAVPENTVTKKAMTARDVDMGQYITVKNGSPGRLIYKSTRTGETYVWDEVGAEQDIELKELRNARNVSRKFFENNWFVFDEDYDWVIDFLGVRAYYRNIINTEGIDSLFEKSPKTIAAEIAKLTKGQKRTVAYRAMEMIRNKEIDSISTIEALEKELGINLIER